MLPIVAVDYGIPYGVIIVQCPHVFRCQRIEADQHDAVSALTFVIVLGAGYHRGSIIIRKAVDIVKTVALHATTRTVGVQVDNKFVELHSAPLIIT
jgi:hypothetical protein